MITISKPARMHFRRLLLTLVVAWPYWLAAQSSTDLSFTTTAAAFHHDARWPLHTATPFYAVAFAWPDGEAGTLQVRFGESRKKSGPWQPVHADPHARAADRGPAGLVVSALLFAPAGTRWFELRGSGWPQGSLIRMHVYSPGHSTRPPGAAAAPPARPRDCPCPLPAIQTRADWCPDGSCPPDPTPTATTFSHMIVHHSASSSTASDWAAVVRSIWDFHVNVNGWDDIGYNYLVAPDGTLYEGRGDNVLGAHFCGTNTGAMGVCMMGTWTSAPPPDTALATLRDLLAWKS
ncbi:MAG: hypothetical protein D6818_01825, partial [Bacteroidetes bacterium]